MQLYSSHSDDGWSIHQCSFGGIIQSVIVIDYSEDFSEFQKRLKEALKVLGPELEVRELIHTSYLDVSIQGIWDAGRFDGIIPCRSMWDASRKRLAALLILDTH